MSLKFLNDQIIANLMKNVNEIVGFLEIVRKKGKGSKRTVSIRLHCNMKLFGEERKIFKEDGVEMDKLS